MNPKKRAIIFCLVLGLSLPSVLFANQDVVTNLSQGMMLDLNAVNENIEVTPEYSNAVMKAVLPYFSEVSKKCLSVPVRPNLRHKSGTAIMNNKIRQMMVSMLSTNLSQNALFFCRNGLESFG